MTRMSTDSRIELTPQLAIGVLILITGVLLMLDRLDVMEVSGVLRLWPAGLIVYGGSMVARKESGSSHLWGFGLMFLGGWLLLNTLGIVRVGFWTLFWPAALIALGAKLVEQAIGYGPSRTAPRAGSTNLFAVLGGSKRTNTDHPFTGGQMTALMGGCQLDLRQATIAPGDEAIIDILAVMGGVEVWVPAGWSVLSEVVPILGAVDDKRLPMMPAVVEAGAAAAPSRLVLRGYVVMGGLTLNN